MAQYILLRGKHGVSKKNKEGKIIGQKVYSALHPRTQLPRNGFGPKDHIVESDLDLEKKFGSNKFRRLREDGEADIAQSSSPDDMNDGLAELSKSDLIDYAANEEIELDEPKKMKKQDIIDSIRDALAGV